MNSPAWSPDGTMLTYGRQLDPVYYDVWVVGADAGEPRQLVTNAVADW